MTKREFSEKYCRYCGSIVCGGVGDEEFSEGCKLLRETKLNG